MSDSDLERRDIIVVLAWQVWTKNDLGLDADQRRKTMKIAQDAAHNTYFDGISTPEWLTATLAQLG